MSSIRTRRPPSRDGLRHHARGARRAARSRAAARRRGGARRRARAPRRRRHRGAAARDARRRGSRPGSRPCRRRHAGRGLRRPARRRADRRLGGRRGRRAAPRAPPGAGSDARQRQELRMSAHELTESVHGAVRLVRRHVPEVHVLCPDATAANRSTLLAPSSRPSLAAGASGLSLGDAGGATLPADIAALVADRRTRCRSSAGPLAVRPSDELGLAGRHDPGRPRRRRRRPRRRRRCGRRRPGRSRCATIAALLAVARSGTPRPAARRLDRRTPPRRTHRRSLRGAAGRRRRPAARPRRARRPPRAAPRRWRSSATRWTATSCAPPSASSAASPSGAARSPPTSSRPSRPTAIARPTIGFELGGLDVRSASGDLAPGRRSRSPTTRRRAAHRHRRGRRPGRRAVPRARRGHRRAALRSPTTPPRASAAAPTRWSRCACTCSDGDARLAGQALGADVLDASARAWLRAAARATADLPAPESLEQPRS